MLNILSVFFAVLSSVFRNHVALQVEILALRHQIGVLQRSARGRPKLSAADRFLWAWLSGVWSE
jgi:putative transposase